MDDTRPGSDGPRTDASYLETTHELYREAALEPQAALCCSTGPTWRLPGLSVPAAMLEMNYGCGTTVNPRDLRTDMTILYVGVGAGLEALQFSYFTRRPGSVIAVDRVPEMLDRARDLLEEAARENDWFDPSFVELRTGDALDLPVDDGSIDLAAQNCLFNIFVDHDRLRALREMRRTLVRGGGLVLSDPVTPVRLPEALVNDERLRAMCLTGAPTYEAYVDQIVEAGFGTVEVRARRPYRVLDPERYDVPDTVVLESVELAAMNVPIPADGPCVFTGQVAFYVGGDECFDDGHGHILTPDVPLGVCEKTAGNLRALGRSDLVVTDPTYHYDGGGCC